MFKIKNRIYTIRDLQKKLKTNTVTRWDINNKRECTFIEKTKNIVIFEEKDILDFFEIINPKDDFDFDSEEFVTPKEMQDIYNFHKQSLFFLIRNNKFPCMYLKHERTFLVRKLDFEIFIADYEANKSIRHKGKRNRSKVKTGTDSSITKCKKFIIN